MQPMHPLSKAKFLQLKRSQQHKILSTLLRRHLEENAPLKEYLSLAQFIQLPDLQTDIESLSNRFHEHMQIAYPNRMSFPTLNIRSYDTWSDVLYLPIDIYLDNLRSCHNVGSILRTTEAFRLGTVHCIKHTPDNTHPKVQDRSQGTCASVTCKRDTPLTALRQPLIALETTESAINLHDFSFPKEFSLLLGNEEYGLSKESLKAADQVVQIPLCGAKNSLNVACAFAIVAAKIRAAYPV